MKWCIYMHINKINGKKYIGQTCRSVEERSGIDGRNYKKHNLYFWNAINKYGWENFEHIILEENISTRKMANEREIFYINLHRTYVGFKDCNGYNLSLGGDNREHLGNTVYQIDMKSLKIIKEYPSVREAAKETCIGRTAIDQCCNKNGLSITGKGYYWCYAKDYSEDWSPKKPKNRSDGALCKPVYQIDMKSLKIIARFKSLTEASKQLKCKASGIGLCCKRVQYKCANFFWCYEKDYTPYWKPIENQKSLKNKKCVRISVKDLKNIKYYNSLTEASLENHIPFSIINRCCKGERITAGNFYWLFQENYNDSWKPIPNNNSVAVVCIETKKIYKSITEASKDTNCLDSHISSVCKGERISTNNLHWVYLKEYKETYEIKTPNNFRKCQCVETGEIFETLTEASKKFNLDSSSISKCCKEQKRTCGKFHWKYL